MWLTLESTDDLKFGMVDATTAVALGMRFNLKGYPTLMLFAPSDAGIMHAHHYKGARTKEALDAFGQGGYRDVPGVWLFPLWLVKPLAWLGSGIDACTKHGYLQCGVSIIAIVLCALALSTVMVCVFDTLIDLPRRMRRPTKAE